jgi:ammonia channel protein AmtB
VIKIVFAPKVLARQNFRREVIDVVIGLRVSKEDEIEGLDIALREERGYII